MGVKADVHWPTRREKGVCELFLWPGIHRSEGSHHLKAGSVSCLWSFPLWQRENISCSPYIINRLQKCWSRLCLSTTLTNFSLFLLSSVFFLMPVLVYIIHDFCSLENSWNDKSMNCLDLLLFMINMFCVLCGILNTSLTWALGNYSAILFFYVFWYSMNKMSGRTIIQMIVLKFE